MKGDMYVIHEVEFFLLMYPGPLTETKRITTEVASQENPGRK